MFQRREPCKLSLSCISFSFNSHPLTKTFCQQVPKQHFYSITLFPDLKIGDLGLSIPKPFSVINTFFLKGKAESWALPSRGDAALSPRSAVEMLLPFREFWHWALFHGNRVKGLEEHFLPGSTCSSPAQPSPARWSLPAPGQLDTPRHSLAVPARWQSHWPRSPPRSFTSFKRLKQTVQIEQQLWTGSFLFCLALHKSLFCFHLCWKIRDLWAALERAASLHPQPSRGTEWCDHGVTGPALGSCTKNGIGTWSKKNSLKSSQRQDCLHWVITHSLSNDTENKTTTNENENQPVLRSYMFPHSSSEVAAQKTHTNPVSILQANSNRNCVPSDKWLCFAQFPGKVWVRGIFTKKRKGPSFPVPQMETWVVLWAQNQGQNRSEFSISSQKLYKITLRQQVPQPSLHGKGSDLLAS